MVKKNQFIVHLAEGLSRFGIGIDSEAPAGHDLHKLMLNDTINDVKYVALARRKEASKPSKFWGEVLEDTLKPLLIKTIEGGALTPSALIVPSIDADAVLSEAAKMGAKPTVYQLFDGYVIVGFNRRDSAAIAGQGDNIQNTTEAVAEDTPQPSKPSQYESSHKPSISPRKIAAAALLGVALASIPFALNKLVDPFSSNLTPEEEFSVNTVIAPSVEGTLGDYDVLADLAQKAPLSNQRFNELINDGYIQDVAHNPNLPEEVINYLAKSPDKKIKAAVAGNPATNSDILNTLARDNDPRVRAAAAANPSIPLNTLELLTADPNRHVRSSILDNPNITNELLNIVEPAHQNASCDNRRKIYAGPCIDTSALIYHKDNPDPCIRRGVAANPATSGDILKKMTKDADPDVRRYALANASLPELSLGYYFHDGWLADNDYERTEARKALMRNPNFPPALMERAVLLKPEVYSKSAVNNPSATPKTISALYQYSNKRGGVDGFFNELNALPSNNNFVRKLSNLKKNSTSPDNWLIPLKNTVMGSFKKNIYDPVNLAELVHSSGDDKAYKDGSRIGAYLEPDTLSLDDIGDGGEFFADAPGDVRLNDNVDEDFDAFFGPSKTTRQKEILQTADKIVEDVMKEFAPIMEAAIASVDNTTADSVNNTAMTPAVPHTDAATASSDSGSHRQPLTDAVSGRTNNTTPTTQKKRMLLSEELYNNSCGQINNLIGKF